MAENSRIIHVAAGVLEDATERVLVQKRHAISHQGGLWEFPGGKVEGDETVEQALHRELLEEIGIEVRQAEPLIKLEHNYPDLTVILDVWRVVRYAGRPASQEGQPLMWVSIEALRELPMPEADRPIVDAIEQNRQ